MKLQVEIIPPEVGHVAKSRSGELRTRPLCLQDPRQVDRQSVTIECMVTNYSFTVTSEIGYL